jgi:hypothetical protein
MSLSIYLQAIGKMFIILFATPFIAVVIYGVIQVLINR